MNKNALKTLNSARKLLGMGDTSSSRINLDEKAFDMKKMLTIFNKLKKNDTIKIKYDSSARKGKDFQTFVVTSPKRTVGKKGVERVIMKHVDNPTGVKYTLYNRNGSVSLAIGDMAASMTDIKESVELGEAWTADSVIKNAEIGSKKGYGINIKKTGGVTKTPFKHMLMTMQKHKNVRVTFDHGKDEFEGTPQSVALYINKKLGIKESVELGERRNDVYAIVDKKGKVVAANLISKNAQKESSNRGGARKGFTIVLDPDAKVGDVLKTFARKESVELGEDNTAAIAKQVKQAVKKYTTGKLVVRSKGGKSRFIMVRADKIDNELRKKVLNVVAPTANVRDKSDISYGNISDRIISASVEQWMKALGLKESMSDAEMKKLGITNPLKGKKYPYQDEGKEMKEQTLLQRALNLVEAGGDPRIKKLSKTAKAILAMMANSLETTGGPWLDAKNVIYLTKKGVSDTLKKANKIKNLPSDAKKDLVILKKELGESVKLDPVDKDELKGKHKHRDDKDIDNDGDVDSSDKFLHKRRKAISKAVAETKGDGEEYKKFFKAALKKFGVTQPDQLEGDKKKKFYDYVDKNWKSDKEKAGVEEGSEMDIAKEVFDPSTYKVDHLKAIKSIKNNIKIAQLKLQDNPKPEVRTKLRLSIQNGQKAIKKHQIDARES